MRGASWEGLGQLAQAYDALHGWAAANGYRVVGASRTVALHLDRNAPAQDVVIEGQRWSPAA